MENKTFSDLFKKFFSSNVPEQPIEYTFRKPKDGYLIYRRQYSDNTRKALVFLRDLIKLIIDKRENNKKINREILENLNIDPNLEISSLDAVQKKEFRKRKYIHFFEERMVKNLPEPVIKSFGFYDISTSSPNKRIDGDFFKDFKNSGE